MKIIKTISVITVFLLSVSCSAGSQETFISDFLQKKAELSKLQDNITLLGDEIFIEDNRRGDVKETEEVKNKLMDIQNMLTKEEFERLISNRQLVEEEFVRKEVDDIKIEHLSVKKDAKDEKLFRVKFLQKLYKDRELIKEEEKNFEYTLEVVEKDYKISKIIFLSD